MHEYHYTCILNKSYIYFMFIMSISLMIIAKSLLNAKRGRAVVGSGDGAG